MLLLPSLAMAQGQVTRKPKPVHVKPTPKPTPKINSMTAEQKRIINNLINNMVYVEGGTFTMGATSEQGSDADDNEIGRAHV